LVNERGWKRIGDKTGDEVAQSGWVRKGPYLLGGLLGRLLLDNLLDGGLLHDNLLDRLGDLERVLDLDELASVNRLLQGDIDPRGGGVRKGGLDLGSGDSLRGSRDPELSNDLRCVE
jgi:hypothetical protein